MPTTPYSTPIQFEYKPLNLAAFAVPLAQMQEKFDVTQALINESDVDLTHLDFGTDPVKAAELKETYRQKRDELAKNLVESGNYTQAATKLKELNRLWQTDPERKAIEYNYAARQKYMEEQQKRIDSGKDDQITRDQYYQDIARKDREYAAGQGTYWQHDPNLEKGKYNLYGTKARLSDLEKELEDMTWKVANAVDADKRAGALREIGIDPELMDKKFAQTVIEERDPNKVAAAVSGYIKTLPRFRDWALEVADYNYDALKATNPEGYGEKVNSLTNNALKSINSQIAQIEKKSKEKGQKGLLDSDGYKQLLAYKDEIEQGKATGEFDEQLIKGLYNQESLNKVYDMTALGKVFAYKKIDTDYTFRDIYIPKGSGSGSGGDDDLLAGGDFTPTTYDNLNINNLVTQRVTNAKALMPTNSNINNIAGGNLRTLILGLNGTNYRKDMEKNPGLQREKQELVYKIAAQTIQKGGTAKDFQRALWNAGIREGNNEKSASAVFGALSGNKGNTLNYMREQLDSSQEYFNNWKDAKNQEKAINDKVTELPEFNKYIQKLGATEQVIISADDYDKLKKQVPGLKSQTIQIANPSNPGTTTDAITVSANDAVKLKGYKNLEAVVKANDLRILNNIGITYNKETKKKYGTSDITAGSLIGDINRKQQELIDTKLRGEFMQFRYVGDKKVDQYLNNMFLTAEDLTSFTPAGLPSFDNVKGFDDKGSLLPGTKLILSDKQAVKIVRQGNKMLFEVPYTYNNEDEGKGENTILLEFKKGQEPRQQKILKHIIDLNKENKDADASAKQTYETARAMQYDATYNSDLTQNLFDLSRVYKNDKPIVLETVPTAKEGINVEIVKEYVEGRPPQIFVRVNNGSNVSYLTQNGKKFSTGNVNAAKVFVAENLIGD
jgi:hypothetical protein